MGEVTTFKAGGLPGWLIASDTDNTEFSAGAGAGFGVISLRGKVWRLKHKGEERVLTRNGEPITRLKGVLLRANKDYSKIFYEKKYSEGDDSAPDCFSPNGHVPDPSVLHPQNADCATCPNNAWGSRMTEDGRKAKACQDSRRVAFLIVDPTLDVTTDEPVLLRVPPASLTELQVYADGMAKAGVPLFKIITQLSFDVDSAYPKVLFSAFGWDQDAVQDWIELRSGDVAMRILDVAQPGEFAASAASSKPAAVRAPTVNAAPEGEDDDAPPAQPAAAAAPAATTTRKPRASKAAASTPAAAPAKATTNGKAQAAVEPEPPAGEDGVVAVGDDDDLDALVNGFLGVS